MTALSTEPASRAPAGSRSASKAPAGASPGRHAAGGDGYTARHLTVLEGLDAVRKRPGMYIGSTDVRGLTQCLGEIFDNSVDEALAGACTHIEVILYADGSAEVRDNGRGIPVDNEPRTGLPGVELIMTRLHAGGKFGGGSYTASGGLHGVGASVVNALSARLDVSVDKAGYEWSMSFRRGVPGHFAGEGPDKAFTAGSGLQKGRKIAKTASGTRIRFWPDRQIFVPGADWGFDWLAQQARQTAYLVPGLTIRIADERPAVGDSGGQPSAEPSSDEAAADISQPGRSAEFRFDGGISEFCAHLSRGEPVTDVLRITGSGQFTETVPVLDDSGHLTPTEVERQLDVDLALRWDAGYDSTVRSFVNVIETAKGGTHVTGFERAIVRTVNDQLKAARLLKAGEDRVLKEDVLEGLTAVVSVRLPEPQFEGQTKEVLGTPAASNIVAQVISTELGNFLAGQVRGGKQQARAVLDKIIAAARTRIAAREHRENQRRRSALATSALPAKLVDCRSADDRSELFIVEGDSALGTAKNARNSEFQALLPIRGKILNVQKASLADMLKNAECAAIIQVLGAGSGNSFDLDAARYQRVIFMADADVDGAHIRTLLLTLFHRYMRPMVEAGRVFAAVPPLHRIELTNPRKGQQRYIYTYSDAELYRTLVELERKGQRFKEPPQRYKGLGEMDAHQLAETTMNPRHRVLRRIRIEDTAAAESMFELLMGSDVGPRREFISASASELDPSRIDA
ncbi:MAG TPA: DNA topoisomerase IV subunit B [Streptosporangiaceae bacterium]|nr:DNA topoisomerase IV subunit B [Streptosporangiaceae bacterium]